MHHFIEFSEESNNLSGIYRICPSNGIIEKFGPFNLAFDKEKRVKMRGICLIVLVVLLAHQYMAHPGIKINGKSLAEFLRDENTKFTVNGVRQNPKTFDFDAFLDGKKSSKYDFANIGQNVGSKDAAKKILENVRRNSNNWDK